MKNVTKIEQQEAHEKTWFNRFRKPAGVAVVSTGAVVASSAHAELVVPNFLTQVTTAFTGIPGDLSTFFLMCLGITILVSVFGISRGGVKKGAKA